MAETLGIKLGGTKNRLIWSYIMTLNDGRGITAANTRDCTFTDVGSWYTGHNAYRVLRRRGNESSQTTTSHTFTFNFTTPINAVKVMWSNQGSSDSRRLDTFRVQYSDDSVNWTTAFERTGMTVSDKADEKIDDLTTDGRAHKYWRVYQSSKTDNHIDIKWLDFVVKV